MGAHVFATFRRPQVDQNSGVSEPTFSVSVFTTLVRYSCKNAMTAEGRGMARDLPPLTRTFNRSTSCSRSTSDIGAAPEWRIGNIKRLIGRDRVAQEPAAARSVLFRKHATEGPGRHCPARIGKSGRSGGGGSPGR